MEMKFKRVQIGVDALKDEIEGMGDTEKKQQCIGRVELMRAELDQIEKVVFKTGEGDE